MNDLYNQAVRSEDREAICVTEIVVWLMYSF